MKIGIFGATLDTIHDGHKAIIDDMLKRVDVLYIVPTSISYYKKGKVLHDFEERYSIIKQRVYYGVVQKPDYNKIIVSDIERDKGADWGFVDTLKVIKKRYPNQEIFTALGADSFINLPTWRDYKTVIANTKFVVYNRPGYNVNDYPKDIPYEFVNISFDCSSTKDREKIRGMTDEEFEDLLDESWWNKPID